MQVCGIETKIGTSRWIANGGHCMPQSRVKRQIFLIPSLVVADLFSDHRYSDAGVGGKCSSLPEFPYND